MMHEEIETALGAAVLDLLKLCISAVCHVVDYLPGTPSYDVLLMLGHMYASPQWHDAHVLTLLGEQLGINALGFAGFFVHQESCWA